MSSRSAALRAEDGFTIIEVLAACVVLLVGVLGVVATLDRSREVVSRAEAREAAVYQAERGLEAVRSIPYAQLALSSAPPTSSAPGDPDFYVKAGNRYQWDPRDDTKVSDLVLGGYVPREISWDDGRMRGTLNAYVLEYDDPVVTGPAQARRVLVAATLAGPWAQPRPVVLSTVVHDPTVAP